MACNSDCKNCTIKGNCTEKKYFSLKESRIKKIIAVMSGKGGVGKSTVTANLASFMAKRGHKVGILDADITGPSIPAAFGVHTRLEGNEKVMYPATSKNGIKMVSVNLLLDKETSPVVWRGPVLGSAIRQFYSECIWGDLDYLFIDMPPGTSDIQLTVLNNIPVDGVVIVTTPQDLVSMVVSKAVTMIKQIGIPIVGVIENMSYMVCPCCNEKIMLFGPSHLADECLKYGLKSLGQLPLNSKMTSLIDAGKIEEYETDEFNVALNEIETL